MDGKPLEPEVVKPNFDTTVTHTSLVFVVVCRISAGEVLARQSGWKIGSNPLKGEALACRLALATMDDFN